MIFEISQEIISKGTIFNKKAEFVKHPNYRLLKGLVNFDILSFSKKGGNIYGNKNSSLAKFKSILFINSYLEGEPLITPIEFDEINISKGGSSQPVPEENITDWINYNINDLYYSYYVFLNDKKHINHIQSRFLFFRDFPVVKFLKEKNINDNWFNP
jgi:hypothetical protein